MRQLCHPLLFGQEKTGPNHESEENDPSAMQSDTGYLYVLMVSEGLNFIYYVFGMIVGPGLP